MHDDRVLSPDFPSLIALGNVYSVGKRIESCSRAQNDLRLSNDVRRLSSLRTFTGWFM